MSDDYDIPYSNNPHFSQYLHERTHPSLNHLQAPEVSIIFRDIHTFTLTQVLAIFYEQSGCHSRFGLP